MTSNKRTPKLEEVLRAIQTVLKTQPLDPHQLETTYDTLQEAMEALWERWESLDREQKNY